ncbi:mechanosensitive ion channel family protein [Desulfovibrio legallii]|uniref:Small-conductance mechanosensitive channel n=1 Tax=Desulfovibrio legallii TaxID=571438 RepID=A0A1G7ITD8_9BACT|nr:mechanosensitive ion channel domain-containing protein [Desulfovibrio legallii]SDF15579.1 Small-conductance mechanosensitive channel [Desulfovibrio legallii]
MRAVIMIFCMALALTCGVGSGPGPVLAAAARDKAAPKADLDAKGADKAARIEAAKNGADKNADKASAKADAAKTDADKGGDKAPAKADAPKADAAKTGADKTDADKPVLPLQDPWEAVWSNQRTMLNEVDDKAAQMSADFSQRTVNLSARVQPYTEEARRLLVLVNTYKNWPNPMEAVSRRITVTMEDLRKLLDPMTAARKEAQGLLERIGYLADSLPEDLQDSSLSPEIQDYARRLTLTRLRLTAVLAQFDAALAPSLALIKRLEKTREEIGAQLPLLWKDYYLQRPVPWLSPDAWRDFSKQMGYSLQGMVLRLPVEIPVTPDRWGTALVRLLIGLLVTGAFCTLLYRRYAAAAAQNATVRHIFRVSLPWLCVGLALLGSSISATGEFFRLLLAVGNLCLIVAQLYLAWDFRRLKYPDVAVERAPFWDLMPLTLGAYVLLYLPLTKALVLLIWLGIVIAAMVRQRRRPRPDLGPLHVEASVLECEPLALWICLVLALSGLHIYSMVLYLLFASTSLALQLCLGGMAMVSNLNDNLPKEGVRAALAHLAVALAAPVVLVAVVVGVSLWIGTLPGGMALMQRYLLQGVSVGSTQFNIVHVLLIITMFYLTRTAVAMGSRFLARLPKQGLTIDSTLIPPMQTAFTYALWCCFGLFVLRALGMELSNLAMVAGGLSVGIGFGMQTIVNNFLSGLILIFSRTLQAGDVVDVGGIQGRVRKISVRATMVETFDNALIIVPNSEFVASRLINWTRNSRTVRREIKIGVAYGSSADQVMKILLAIANSHSNVLKYPPPAVSFDDFGASTLDFTLRFWVRDYDVSVSTSSDIRLEIEKAFREADIEIAFPQLDVHIKDVPAPRALRPAARPAPRPAANPAAAAVPTAVADQAPPRRAGQPGQPGGQARRRPRLVGGRTRRPARPGNAAPAAAPVVTPAAAPAVEDEDEN